MGKVGKAVKGANPLGLLLLTSLVTPCSIRADSATQDGTWHGIGTMARLQSGQIFTSYFFHLGLAEIH